MEPFKNEFSASFISALAKKIATEHKPFKAKRFIERVLDKNWKEKELKERMRHITLALGEFLPENYEQSLKIIIKVAPAFSGLKGMVFPDFIEVYGLEKKYRKKSLNALKELTPYFSSEFAIRPFLIDDLKGTMKEMLNWSKDENEHIRRLASEGCRPRLPWGIGLSDLKKDPSLIWSILENLRNDPSEYVRKSVANNLNDITKDHPVLVFKRIKPWVGKTTATDKLVKHALRTLLKKGDRGAMKLFGYGDAKKVAVKKLELVEKQIAVGDKLNFSFEINVKAKMKIRLEYAIYFLLKNGEFGKKVFKISEKEVEKGVLRMERAHNFKIITTRKYNPGKHKVALIINGIEHESYDFKLVSEKPKWWVYMIETTEGKLYTGITTDLERRFKEHASGKGSKYLRGKALQALVYKEEFLTRSSASKREAAIKKLTKAKKLKLFTK